LLSTTKSVDVIVIGAGIIGCTIAYRLAKQGLKIIVLDRSTPGKEASHAAAGMLAPRAEAAHNAQDELLNLFEASHSIYPEFVAELQEESGVHIGYRKIGSILLATDYQEAKALAGFMARLLAQNRQVEELETKMLKKAEPALADSVQAGLYFKDDHCIDNRQLMSALISAGLSEGVQFEHDTPVIRVKSDNNRITEVQTFNKSFTGDFIVNAAGAWSGMVGPEEVPSCKPPVRPIRGQIIRLQTYPQPLHHMIHTGHCYMVPWPEGRLLIGATMENVGFKKAITAGGMQHLLNAAIRTVPELSAATVDQAWAGLRPDTPDSLPILGKTAIDNLLMATGHFRNGILLAPITAQIICELVLSNTCSVAIEPFLLKRFDKSN
jgi:glycine oxidase